MIKLHKNDQMHGQRGLGFFFTKICFMCLSVFYRFIGMFGCQPLYSWQSRLPLWLCDDRTDLVLHDDVGLNPETEGRRRINVLSLFGRALYGFSAVTLTSDRSSSTLAIGSNSLYILIYPCFT